MHQSNQQIPEQDQLSRLPELQAFLSNPWFFHFVAILDQLSASGVTMLKNMIPQDDLQLRMREQAVGEIRGLERFETISNETLARLLEQQAEQQPAPIV